MGFIENLIKFSNTEIIFDEPMKKHTSYHVGGKAFCFAQPDNIKSLKTIIELCEENNVKYHLLGGGYNTLFSDKYYNGVVISLKKLNFINIYKSKITAFSGVSFIDLTNACISSSLSGIEQLTGIPGTIGGIVAMNAGAFDKNISNVVSSVVSLREGKIIKRYNNQCAFGYRRSIFSNNNEIILSVDLELSFSDKISVENLSKGYLNKRIAIQPKGLSCGSIFKNPIKNYAGKLIDEAGLKGKKIGGAYVSNKHANFIINDGSASSNDIYSLINYVKKCVQDKYGITLKEEVVLVGDF